MILFLVCDGLIGWDCQNANICFWVQGEYPWTGECIAWSNVHFGAKVPWSARSPAIGNQLGQDAVDTMSKSPEVVVHVSSQLFYGVVAMLVIVSLLNLGLTAWTYLSFVANMSFEDRYGAHDETAKSFKSDSE